MVDIQQAQREVKARWEKGAIQHSLGFLKKATNTWADAMNFQRQMAIEAGHCTDVRFLQDRGWTTALGHLAVLDVLVKGRLLGMIKPEYIVLADQPYICNAAYLNLFKKYLRMYQRRGFAADVRLTEDYLSVIEIDGKWTWYIDAAEIVQKQWDAEGLQPLIKLTDKQIEAGRSKLGLAENDWFVTLHVRRLGDLQNLRDIKIEGYNEVIKLIRDRGGKVFIVPSGLMATQARNDYDNQADRETDIFLLAQSRFNILGNSGPAWAAGTLGTPTLLANWCPTGIQYPYKNSIVLHKKLRHMGSGKFFTPEEYVEPYNQIVSVDVMNQMDVEAVENTSEEIVVGVEKMLQATEATVRGNMSKLMPVAVEETVQEKIDHNYLPAQFAEADAIWAKIRKVVQRGDFTLGEELHAFEEKWAKYVGVRHAIGVNSGTDALILSIKAMGIHGEVLVPAFGFVASAAAVELGGAKVRFVDVGDDFNIDIAKLNKAITPATEAIMVVHWAGRCCQMGDVLGIAKTHGLLVIEDACHAIGTTWKNGVHCGAIGDVAAFSLHPLKNVNVWGDGGVITTNSNSLADKLRRMRNHGLQDRNTCVHWGNNSRLDTVQSVVASHMLDRLPHIIACRRFNALTFDTALRGVKGITTPPPQPGMTYYLYSIRATRRDELAKYLNDHGVDAKVHYPTPIYLQPAAQKYGLKKGDLPGADAASAETLSLPVHEFISQTQVDYMAGLIRRFYED